MGVERTKGPWEVDRGYRDAWINNGHTTIPDDHLTIYCGDEAIENFDPEKHNYIEVRGPDQEANAAFIVRAANSHEELVAALKECGAGFIIATGNIADGSVQKASYDDVLKEFNRRQGIAQAALAKAVTP